MKHILILLIFSGCATHYPLNLPKYPSVRDDVDAAAAFVAINTPKKIKTGDDFDAFILSHLLNGKTLPLRGKELLKGEKKQQKFLKKLADGDLITRSFITRYKGRKSYQEITTGYIFLPREQFLKKFNPPLQWGKNLVGYEGGELKIDEQIDGKPALIRERMVVETPWYTIGAPDMDMSKYEVIHYGEKSIRINWMVLKSGNNSVYEDVGYLIFKEIELKRDQKRVVQVIFNSIHRVDPGIFSWMIPDGIIDTLTRESLEDMFSDDIKNYRRIVK